MVDRFVRWVGVGVVATGVSMAMIGGAGVAAADDGTTSAGGGGGSSTSSNSVQSHRDSNPNSKPDTHRPASSHPRGHRDGAADKNGAADKKGAADKNGATDKDDAAGKPAATNPDTSKPADQKQADDGGQAGDVAGGRQQPEPPARENSDVKSGADAGKRDRKAAATKKDEPTARAADIPAAHTPALDSKPRTTSTDEVQAVKETTAVGRAAEPDVVERKTVRLGMPAAMPAADLVDTPEVAAVTFASAPTAATSATATAPPLTALLSAIGTVVFNLYALATRLVGGPPILPPGSHVTVRSSTVQIDCGQGYQVPADWYIPDSAEENPPQRLIYFSHGFLASGPWYSHTAAALAEQTNSIVVATSITSNFLSCDACWLGAPPMQQAIAKLFAKGNTALADSAIAAGYDGPIPDRVVLMGHSLGGGLVAGAGGFMSQDAYERRRLAGVVMLDGVGLDKTMAESLSKIPDDIPVYQLAAPRYFWNQFGVGTDALLQARGDGQFIGVTLAGGSHVDSMQGGNPLIQFAEELVAGFTTPQNAEAAKILMVGWVNDMFAGNRATGIYPTTGQVSILTPAGAATAVALPNSLTKPFFLNFLQPFVALGDGLFTFEPTCVAASMGGKCPPSIAA